MTTKHLYLIVWSFGWLLVIVGAFQIWGWGGVDIAVGMRLMILASPSASLVLSLHEKKEKLQKQQTNER